MLIPIRKPMKKLYYCVTLLLFTFQAQAGFLCDMLINDVNQTQEYEQAYQDLKKVRTTLDEIDEIRKDMATGKSLEEINPDLYHLHDMVKQALAEEEKMQGRNAKITVALDAGALTFAFFLWRSYAKNPQSLNTVVRHAIEKKFNPKVWLIPGLVASVVTAGYMRYLMNEKKQRITSLREHLQVLAQAQVKQEYITYLEDIIEDNYSTLQLEKARLIQRKCLKSFEFEEGQNYCEEHPEVIKSQNFDHCF